MSNCTVVCFAVIASGGLGPAAIKLLAALLNRGLGNSGAVDEMELSWLVPSHGKYWHRRFRGIATELRLDKYYQSMCRSSLSWRGFCSCRRPYNGGCIHFYDCSGGKS